MLIIKDSIYNPKIDYLICKNLSIKKKYIFDEYRLRDVFNEKISPRSECEKNILKLKNFFQKTDLKWCSLENIEKILFLILNKQISFSKYYWFTIEKITNKSFVNLGTLLDIDDFISSQVILSVCLLCNSINFQDVPIIPYKNLIIKLMDKKNIIDGNMYNSIYSLLIKKRDKYLKIHDCEAPLEGLKFLNNNIEYIIKEWDLLKVFTFGSISLGNYNEYSDFDILVVIKDEKSKLNLKYEIEEYLKEGITMPLDILIYTKKEFSTSLSIGIKKTLKIVGENHE